MITRADSSSRLTGKAEKHIPGTRVVVNLWHLAGLICLAITWDIVAFVTKTPFMPRLTEILNTMMSLLLTARAWTHIIVSVERVLTGLAIAVCFGILLGILMTQFRLVMYAMSPVIDVMRSIAGLAIYPLLILFLGLQDAPKIFLVFWGAWPPIILNTIHGIIQVDSATIEAAKIDGANRFRLLRHIIFPLSVSTILTGIRIGAGIGWISVVASEMLSGNNGLGYFVLTESQVFHFPQVYAGIAFIALLGLMTHFLLTNFQILIEGRLYL